MSAAMMCVRVRCDQRGLPVDSPHCPACRLPTRPWDEQQAARIRRPGTGIRSSRPSEVLIVTTNDVPGFRVEKVLGDVFGLIVLARNAFSNLGAQLRTVTGGEVGGYTTLLVDSRNEARERLRQEARARGANAVLAMRFDCNAIGEIMSEVAAYGTAVKIVPIPTSEVAETDLAPGPTTG